MISTNVKKQITTKLLENAYLFLVAFFSVSVVESDASLPGVGVESDDPPLDPGIDGDPPLPGVESDSPPLDPGVDCHPPPLVVEAESGVGDV